MSIPFQPLEIKSSVKLRLLKIIIGLVNISAIVAITHLKVHIFITACIMSAVLLTWCVLAYLSIKQENRDSKPAFWLIWEISILTMAVTAFNHFILKSNSEYGWFFLTILLCIHVIPNMILKIER